MSKNEKSNNAYIIGGAAVIIAALLAFFGFPGSDTSTNDVVTNAGDASDKTVSVEKVITTEDPEEIVVTGEGVNNIIVEKANEAAERAQTAEDADVTGAE